MVSTCMISGFFSKIWGLNDLFLDSTFSTESVITAEDGSTIKTRLEGDDFFGAEILKKGGPKKYTNTVTAEGKVTCWILQKADIKRVLGTLRKSGSATIA